MKNFDAKSAKGERMMSGITDRMMILKLRVSYNLWYTI